jgi:hypothetical protein
MAISDSFGTRYESIVRPARVGGDRCSNFYEASISDGMCEITIAHRSSPIRDCFSPVTVDILPAIYTRKLGAGFTIQRTLRLNY